MNEKEMYVVGILRRNYYGRYYLANEDQRIFKTREGAEKEKKEKQRVYKLVEIKGEQNAIPTR